MRNSICATANERKNRSPLEQTAALARLYYRHQREEPEIIAGISLTGLIFDRRARCYTSIGIVAVLFANTVGWGKFHELKCEHWYFFFS